MAWRPYANLIDGELNNDTPGKVTGWMRFFRRDMTPLRVSFDLVGDFREDIHGRRIRLTNPQPSDENIALDRVLDTSIRRRGKRRDQRTSRKR